MNHNEETKIQETPCPRCRCYLARHFACNCGAVHGDYCINCGRFTSCGPNEYLDLSPADAPCTHGAVMHDHPFSEKSKRMEANSAAIDVEIKRSGAKTYDEVRAVVERWYAEHSRVLRDES